MKFLSFLFDLSCSKLIEKEKIEKNPNLDHDNQFVKSFSQDIVTHAFETCSVSLWFFSKYYKVSILDLISYQSNF